MDILERFNRIISETQTPFVLEFGSCDAHHSRMMLDILQSTGKSFDYHLFEPNKNLIPNIERTIGFYLSTCPNNIKFFNEAIGAECGNIKFYQSGGYLVENGQVKDSYYGSSSIREPKIVKEAWKDITFTETTCDAVTLDYHLKRSNFENRIIDFIWADIQGAEIDLISGGKESFKNVRYFYTEYVNSEYYKGQGWLHDICNMLPDFEIVEDYGGDVLLKNKKI